MESAVPVGERVNEDEAEGDNCSLDHGVDRRVLEAACTGEEAIHERPDVGWLRGDVVDPLAREVDLLPHVHLVRAPSAVRESVVNGGVLKPDKVGEVIRWKDPQLHAAAPQTAQFARAQASLPRCRMRTGSPS